MSASELSLKGVFAKKEETSLISFTWTGNNVVYTDQNQSNKFGQISCIEFMLGGKSIYFAKLSDSIDTDNQELPLVLYNSKTKQRVDSLRVKSEDTIKQLEVIVCFFQEFSSTAAGVLRLQLKLDVDAFRLGGNWQIKLSNIEGLLSATLIQSDAPSDSPQYGSR